MQYDLSVVQRLWHLDKSSCTSKGHTKQHQATPGSRSYHRVACDDDRQDQEALAIGLGGEGGGWGRGAVGGDARSLAEGLGIICGPPHCNAGTRLK